MKVLLVTDGGFEGLESVKFPVEVDARVHELGTAKGHGAVQVSSEELIKVGADPDWFALTWFWTFLRQEHERI